MAFAHAYNKDNGVCLTYMGDGAANQGQVYESFNMASLWKLPVVYVIEDNQYSMGTAVARHAASGDFSKRGEAYGIPGYTVDGMDIFSVRKIAQAAIEHARSDKGPVLLHVKTYRYRGHSMSDPAKYRTKDEVEGMREHRDPIENLKNHMLQNKIISEDELKIIEKSVKDIVQDSADFAQTSPEPEASELYTDVLIAHSN
jgi:pyruvate dehydrogenase E1 component alpha subunit